MAGERRTRPVDETREIARHIKADLAQRLFEAGEDPGPEHLEMLAKVHKLETSIENHDLVDEANRIALGLSSETIKKGPAQEP